MKESRIKSAQQHTGKVNRIIKIEYVLWKLDLTWA